MSLKKLWPTNNLFVIHYVDLAAYDGNSTSHEFFDSAQLATLITVGWIKEVKVNGLDCIKILNVHDLDGGENSEGTVIPRSVIKSMERVK